MPEVITGYTAEGSHLVLKCVSDESGLGILLGSFV